VLADGRVLTVGGSWSGAPGQKTGEVWSPTTNTWTTLPGVLSEPLHTNDIGGKYRSDNHYWLFTAPNGKVFHAGPSKMMHWIDLAGTGSVTNSVLRGDDDDAMTGNSLIYDTGKIFTVGGAANYDTGAGSNRAYVIDINGAEATVTRTGNMYYKRTHSNSVLLPNGEVVVIGGQTGSFLFTDQASVYQPEIWTPSTGKFRVLAPMKVPRVYHSVAILMKDGRVWASGGGLCDMCTANHADFEILTPPYLLRSAGVLATRSTIVQVSKTVVKAGESIAITMNNTGLHTFALVRTSAVTHSTNTDQRRIPLRALSKGGAVTTVQIPANINVSVVGVYYLFAMNSAGVPSVAQTVRITL
jgi:galactose oxidase